jgi:hypothetical protein
MIDLSLLKPTKLRDSPPGALFVPVVKNGDYFLAGRVNDYPVLVAVDGEDPFHVADRDAWTRAAGLIVQDIRFQVNVQSAIPARSELDVPPGALVLASAGTSVIGQDRNGRKAVLLAGGKGPTALAEGDVAFTAWRIVSGEADALQVHYEVAVKQAAE